MWKWYYDTLEAICNLRAAAAPHRSLVLVERSAAQLKST